MEEVKEMSPRGNVVAVDALRAFLQLKNRKNLSEGGKGEKVGS